MTHTTNSHYTAMDPAGEFPLTPQDYVLHLLASVALFRDAALDRALRPLGLNISRYRVLGVLARFGQCTMTQVANFTAMDRTTLTRIADQLVKAGQIVRSGAPADRRRVMLDLTDEGRAAHGPAVQALLDYNRRVLSGVPEPVLRSTAYALMAAVENIAPNRAARDAILRVGASG
jgi:DNA-binding MarR family transcriptional regulator